MINLIAAVGKQGQIGLRGTLPWQDRPELDAITELDHLWFRRLTDGGVLLIGSATYSVMVDQGFDPNDRHIALWNREIASHMTPGRYLSEIMAMYRGRDIWVCGGARVYETFMPFVQRHYIASIPYDGEADAFMPPICEAWDKADLLEHRSMDGVINYVRTE